MKVIVMPNLIGAFGIVPKSLEERLEKLKIRRFKSIQTTTLLRSARILRRVQETCCHSDFCERLPPSAVEKNLAGYKILMIMIIFKKENLLNSGLCRPGIPQNENQRKRKKRQELETC